MARFYATTEQKLINSFWNALIIRRKINQLHQSSCYTSSIYYTTQNNRWICKYRFNAFFCITPHTHKIKKCTVEFHTSKNILKMIKQRNQSRQVLLYISNTHFYPAIGTFAVQICYTNNILGEYPFRTIRINFSAFESTFLVPCSYVHRRA